MLSFLQDKREFFNIISYNLFLIRVCFTPSYNVKVTFVSIGWIMVLVDRSPICKIFCNKNVDIKLVHTIRIWNNLHRVRSKSKDLEAK
jgi:hypothetical protein